MRSFVAWHGQVPTAAKRIEDHEAHRHGTAWLRRHIGGRGIVHSYVIGYVLGERWWTLFFQRASSTTIRGAEVWWIEAYDHSGASWSDTYSYFPDGRWRLAPQREGYIDQRGGIDQRRKARRLTTQ
jgi:hypothetical protein